MRSPLALASLLVVACSTSSAPKVAAPSAVSPVAVPAAAMPLPGSVPGAVTLAEHGKATVGAPVPAGVAQPIATILAEPASYAGKTVLVEGTVRAACSKKGCWMELASGSEPGPACRIKFKDYAFFVPTTSRGADARLSGEVKVRTLGVEEVAHLEREGAHLTKGADGSAQAVEITATGVELTRL